MLCVIYITLTMLQLDYRRSRGGADMPQGASDLIVYLMAIVIIIMAFRHLRNQD